MKLVRRATKQDMPRVLELILELAVYEKEPDAVQIDAAYLQNAGFKDQPEFVCFVVEVDDIIQGIALVYNRFSTWRGTILHLEDLIVSQKFRGKGLGSALLDEVVTYGASLGVKSVTWHVLDWNEPAIKFYELKGANVLRDWDVVDLNETAIQNYLNTIN